MLQDITTLLEQISLFASQQMVLVIIACAAALMLINRPKIALLLLFLQCILLAIFIGPRVYGPLVLVQAGIGFAMCLILLVSINHLQESQSLDKQTVAASGWFYRILIIAFSGLAAYGLWRANIFQLTLPEGMVSYFLISIGLVMATVSNEPLRLGFGILVGVNGFETASVFMNQGLLVIGIWGIIDILLALVIAAGIEVWVEGHKKAMNS